MSVDSVVQEFLDHSEVKQVLGALKTEITGDREIVDETLRGMTDDEAKADILQAYLNLRRVRAEQEHEKAKLILKALDESVRALFKLGRPTIKKSIAAWCKEAFR